MRWWQFMLLLGCNGVDHEVDAGSDRLNPLGGGRSGASAAASDGATATGGSGPGSATAGASGRAATGMAGATGGSIARDSGAGGGGMDGGASNAAGTGTADGASNTAGAGGATDPLTYPALDPAAIGTPVQIANGFGLAESPVWDPCEHQLLFSDVQGGGGRGVINALGADGNVSVVMMNTANTNGFAYDIDGSLILTQMGGKPGHVARRDLTGTVTVIDPAGSMLHTPDDVVVRSDGTIYFSDGDFCPIGTLLGYLSALPVYMIKPGTSTLVNVGTTTGPNGIELSPDEKVLYVAGYGNGTLSAFDVADDGTPTKRATPLVSGLTDPDSLCLDAAGNLYLGVSSGLQVLRSDGTKVKLIPITAPAGSCTKAGVTNCTFGGDDGKTLYITTWTTLFKIDAMPIPGLDWIVGKQRAKCM
jgi:gluconolactonase